jgi:hypothetical protein
MNAIYVWAIAHVPNEQQGRRAIMIRERKKLTGVDAVRRHTYDESAVLAEQKTSIAFGNSNAKAEALCVPGHPASHQARPQTEYHLSEWSRLQPRKPVELLVVDIVE